ncbi:hypothetical protein VTH82DRAFT_8076 [Thermothelomyces myriococcoides]
MATNKSNSGEVSAAISFLNDAGHLLAATCPEVSAYLMSKRNDLLFEHEQALPDKQRQHVCSCCGHIILPGRGDLLQIKAVVRVKGGKKARMAAGASGKGKGAPQKHHLQSSRGPVKMITCGFCGRMTNIQLSPPSPIQRRKVTVEKGAKIKGSGTMDMAQDTPSHKTASNASSKKRAKTRKAGLQALLEQSGASRNTKPGLGLSLADFLQK